MRANFERYVDQITQNVIALLNVWKIQTIGSKLSVIENRVALSNRVRNLILGVLNDGFECDIPHQHPHKATGSDEIPARLLKETARIITPSICKLFNKSLQQGTVPQAHAQDWKLANVVPIYKKGDKEYTKNYRPISLLPIISKVLERCIFINIRQHFSRIIYDHQHGFLQGKSCVTNLLEALDYVGACLDKGGQVDMVYLDMSKAFDRINHKRLTQKLANSGIGGNLLKWFQSYLTDRRQRVTVLGVTSNYQSLYQFVQAFHRGQYSVLHCFFFT
jgi:hypothetical protein